MASPVLPSAERSMPQPAAETRASGVEIRVTYIGMHIGGGPNDAATKAPFERDLRGAFDAIARCGAVAGGVSGTFGADFLVPKEGGRADVSNARSALPEAALSCITRAFGEIEFHKPRRGATKLSYSVRLSPGAR